MATATQVPRKARPLPQTLGLLVLAPVPRAQRTNTRVFFSTVKPTVIDVDIYVNSIGPVSSINMVRNDFFSDPMDIDSLLACILVVGFC